MTKATTHQPNPESPSLPLGCLCPPSGDTSIAPPLVVDKATVWGDRYFTLSYDIYTNLNCPAAPNGGNFCYMQASAMGDLVLPLNLLCC